MNRTLMIVIILSVSLLINIGRQPAEAQQFQGRVFEGNVGTETTPLSGVTVKLYGCSYSNPIGIELTSATTDNNGWYNLVASASYDYFNIIEIDPTRYSSQGATTVSGTVVSKHQIQYTAPLDGKTLTGNKFNCKNTGAVNHPPVANAGGPYSEFTGNWFDLDASGSYDPDPDESIVSYVWETSAPGYYDSDNSGSSDKQKVAYTRLGHYIVVLTVTDSHGASAKDTTTLTVNLNCEGQVFEGAMGVETTLMHGVTVKLYGSNDPAHLGTEIASTTTDENGWFNLKTDIPSQVIYTFYAIVEIDPYGYNSAGARSDGGTVVNANEIQYTAGIIGFGTASGNKFYIQKIGLSGVDDENTGTRPDHLTLYPNYPNPFNPSTIIAFSIPHSCDVSLRVYSMVGKEIATLAAGHYNPGTYSKVWDAGNLPSGVYLCRLQAGNFVRTRKLLLLR